MHRLICLLVLALGSVALAAEADPLAKFPDEKLIDPGFCFMKFAEAVNTKDAVVAKAFLAETPKALQGLDLKKEADRAKFVAAFSKYAGAQPVKAQRFAIAGLAEVTYTDANGATGTVRMKNMGGRWKLVAD